jgi:hypothetical protein
VQAPGENRVLAVKLAKRKLDEDLRLLTNRVAHLKMEEERANKKVAETKAKSKQVRGLGYIYVYIYVYGLLWYNDFTVA